MTSYEVLYIAFFNRIEKDEQFFNYNGVSKEDALILAKSRAKNYLIEAVNTIKLKCTLDINIQLDDNLEEISVDLTSTEILLISSLMYEIYLSRDIALLKSMVNALTSTDIKLLYAPANERKTFMDMFKTIQEYNLTLIDNYNGRDRLTGKRKLIDYSSYGI